MLRGRKHGVSLIEVLVAIVIFMVGLMGLLAGAARTIRTNQDAFLSSHATNVVNTYVAMMRRNSTGVIGANYNGTMTASARSVAFTSACESAVCTPAQIADDDKARLNSLMGQTMPPTTSLLVACPAHAENAAIAGLVREYAPVYSGVCSLTFSWPSDKSGNRTTRVWSIKP
jgi:type IV pilus assembly protein PilV